jgi:hypothetical protein
MEAVLDQGTDALPRADRLKGILSAGIRAPSAENRHFLRFDVGQDKVDLISTDTPTWPDQPHRRMLALVSYGAVVENMSVQASSYGLAQITEWFPDPARIDLIARCRWQATTHHADPLATVISDRHTNRHFFRRAPVDDTVLGRMADEAASVPGARIIWFKTPAERRAALRAIRIAETERFRQPALHAELFSAVRFEAGWKETTEEGLPPGALGVELPMRPGFAAMRHWPLMRALTHIGAHHGLGFRAAYLPCRLAPVLGLVVHADKDPLIASVSAGRALERAWLASTEAGLGFQPMAAATVLARQRPGEGWVSATVQRQLIDLLNTITGEDARQAQMFFRVGHARSPELVTDRPPLERFL